MSEQEAAASHWSRDDEAISGLEWHKSDGSKTIWPHMYIYLLSMGSWEEKKSRDKAQS